MRSTFYVMAAILPW